MIYKLYIYGEKELFAYTEIFNDAFLKEGDLFTFEAKKYKILRITRYLKRLVFNDKGEKLFDHSGLNLKEYLQKEGAPELIITEVPEV